VEHNFPYSLTVQSTLKLYNLINNYFMYMDLCDMLVRLNRSNSHGGGGLIQKTFAASCSARGPRNISRRLPS
jgi:hypothetical protein